MTWNPFNKKAADGTPKPDEQSKSEVDQLVERLTTSLDAKLDERLKPVTQRVETLATEWNGIKEAANKPEPEKREPADITTDPERWKQEALGPLQVQVVLANARITEKEVLDSLGQRWKHLLPQVQAMLDGTPWQRKALPDYKDYVKNVLDVAIGKAARENGLRYDDQNQKFFLEDANSKTEQGDEIFDASTTWIDPRSGRTLTAAQQLAKLGIDPKEYAESVKKGVV
jgi:hypothetical protein